jgi:hypothetical protein
MGKNNMERLRDELHIPSNLYQKNDKYRGMCSSIGIEKNKCVLTIPETSMIKAKDISFFNLFKGKVHDNSIFAFFLYLESLKKKDSKFYLYMATFPSETSVRSDYPLYLSKNIKEEIKNTDFGKFLIQHETEIKKDYDYISQHSYHSKNIDYNKYLYYRLLVTSRIFQYDDILYMVPFADLFNHNENKSSIRWFYDEDKKVFVFQSTKKIKANEQIYNSYGSKNNHVLYLYYGFTIPSLQKSKKYKHLKDINLLRVLP